jgi:hypothetical protein
MTFLALARYSSVTPSTISTLARPRIDSARAVPGVSPPSIVRATSGRADSALTLLRADAGEFVVDLVPLHACSPFRRSATIVIAFAPGTALFAGSRHRSDVNLATRRSGVLPVG